MARVWVYVVAYAITFVTGFFVGAIWSEFDAAKVHAMPETAKAASAPPIRAAMKYEWRENADSVSWTKEWNLVGDDDRVYASITKYEHDAAFDVWRNGAGYGQFATLDAAKKQAEKVARQW